MNLALAVWGGRISPVFDVSRRLSVLKIENNQVVSQNEHTIDTDAPFQKTDQLTELGIETLICGAISYPLAEMIKAKGIKLVPFIAGEVDAVLMSFLAGNLSITNMSMPGCCGQRMRFRGGHGRRGRHGKIIDL